MKFYCQSGAVLSRVYRLYGYSQYIHMGIEYMQANDNCKCYWGTPDQNRRSKFSEQKIEIFRTEIFLSGFARTHLHQGNDFHCLVYRRAFMNLLAVIWFGSYDFHGEQICCETSL